MPAEITLAFTPADDELIAAATCVSDSVDVTVILLPFSRNEPEMFSGTEASVTPFESTFCA